LKEICENNLQNHTNYLIIDKQIEQINFKFISNYPEEDSKNLAVSLMKELTFFDVETNSRFTGLLEKKQLLQIISSIASDIHQ
jgi:hypothetical protein